MTTTFKELGLQPELMQSLDDLGFVEPSPIQEKAIPHILKSKKDLIALAQTGTGKTAAFSLPILNQMKAGEKDLQVIILCPTRELCLQIFQDIQKFTKYSKGIKATPVYGGERIDIQIKALKRGTNIVVGTPGRVHDLIRKNILKLQSIKWLVLDEADEMLDMGFKEDLDAILGETPETRQTLLFSATISRSVHNIAKNYMRDAQEISVGEKNVGSDQVSHEYYITQGRDRFEALKRILDSLPGVYGIIFCRTRIETQEIADKLKQAHYDTEALHGEISQNLRTKIMDRFKRKQVHLLVATDVAARGIDVSNLTHVINYNLPDQSEAYTHRSGRTGRAKQVGVSLSIINPRETRRIRDLERVIGKTIEYKKIPDGKEVCAKQIDKYVEEVANTTIDKIDSDEHFTKIVEKLKKLKKEDLIKHFVAYRFTHLMDGYKNSRDLNASFGEGSRTVKKPNPNNITLKINLGKKDGFDTKGLLSLVNENKNLKGIEIGTINLLAEYSLFSIDKKHADKTIKNLKGEKFKGDKVQVVRSNETVVEFEREGRSRSRNRGWSRSSSGGRSRSGSGSRSKSFSPYSGRGGSRRR